MKRQLGPFIAWSQQRDPAALAELKPRLDAFCGAVDERCVDCARLLSAPESDQAG